MGFRFSLETLLRVRRSYERREWLRLARLMQESERCREESAKAVERMSVSLAALQVGLAKGMLAGELQFSAESRAAAVRLRTWLDEQAGKLEQQVRQQRDVLLRARRARRVLESLRDKQLQAYQRDESRREQQRLDDLHLLLSGEHRHQE